MNKRYKCGSRKKRGTLERNIDVEGCGNGLVAVVVGTVEDVSGVGRVVAQAVAATVVVVTRCAVLGIDGSYTRLHLLMLMPPGSNVCLWQD
jgi:Na+-translocating ferredoxin:NAD+ oxidoreductase RnfE subunit